MEDFALGALNRPEPWSALAYGFLLEQPIWNGGAEVTAPAVASSARRDAGAVSRAAVAGARLDVVRRYVGYVGARERARADSKALASVALGVWVSPWLFAFTAFVGANLLQSAFTHSCPMMWILKKAGCRAD